MNVRPIQFKLVNYIQGICKFSDPQMRRRSRKIELATATSGCPVSVWCVIRGDL